MGMNIGNADSSGNGEPEIMSEINTTPLIDVMLVLLIMLIITIPMQLHSVNLNLPAGNPTPPVVEPEVVRIDITSEGAVLWNGETLADPAAVEARLTGAAGQSVKPELHVRPDKHVAYRNVAAVLASIQRHGLTKVGIVGAEQFL